MPSPIRVVLVLALIVTPATALPQDDPLAALDEVFAEWDSDESPGMAVAVVHKGRIIYECGFGMADLEGGVPVTPDTIFRIGSTSKQFTALCIALLAQEDRLDLDADIRTWLPEMAEQDPPVTVRHLVHHVSGIPAYVNLHVADGVRLEDVVRPPETYARLCEVTTLDFAPGTNHAYSNSNYFLMSLIVEKASGKTLRSFAEEHLFAPLEMDRSHFHDKHDEPVEGRANGYSPAEPGGWRVHNTTWDHVGDGGVFTTVRDLAKWDAIFYDNPLPGGAALIETVLTPGKLADGTELEYAFGLNVGEFRGRPTVSHGGGWVGFRAEMVRYPEQRLSVIVLSNCATADPSRLARRLGGMLLGRSG